MPLPDILESAKTKHGITITANAAAKRLRDANIDPNSPDLTEEEVIAHLQPKPEPADDKDKAKSGLARAERQSAVKGSLATANEKLANSAIASTRHQMTELANVASVEGTIALAETLSSNYNAIADQLTLAGERGVEIFQSAGQPDVIEGETAPPLALPPTAFSLL